MSQPNLRQSIFVWGVFAAGLAVLATLSGTADGLDPAMLSGSYVVLWMTMIVVSALSPVPLPWGASSASLTTGLDVAAFLLFEPALACWIGVLSRLVANASRRWNPFLPAVLSLGEAALAIGIAASVFASLGGNPGGKLALSTSQLLPFAGAAGAYLALRAFVAGGEALLASPKRRMAGLTTAVAATLPGDALLVPVGALLAIAQSSIGSLGVAMFLVPLLLVRHIFNLWAETKRAHLAMARVLMSAVDAGDAFTRDHSQRVSRMCLSVGRHLRMPESALEELEFAALLHDIGRTAIQRDILVKRGKLTHEEQAQMHQHPKIGADLLREMRFFPGAADIVLSHHEQPDGKGYPRAIPGGQIPLGSRIIMVVAAFDAMTSDRPYRRGLSPEQAFEELLAHSGTQFDPDVVEALIHLYANEALFSAFDESHLSRYRAGEEHSRAVEAYLGRQDAATHLPEKAGLPGGRARERADLPVIEFPGATTAPASTIAPAESSMERTIALPGQGGWRLEVAAQSDLGCRRQNNEDSFGVFETDDAKRGCLLVLADGMGGAAAGEVASRLAVDTVHEAYADRKRRGNVRELLGASVRAANEAVFTRASAETALSGMGTTCTTAAVVGRELTLGHVGDSRAYLVTKAGIEQLSRDHTLASELARASGGTVGGPATTNNVLTRSIGAQESVDVDVTPKPIRLEADSVVVLCSDGLSNQVEASEIADIVNSSAPSEACTDLIELARERGGPDNITVVVARVTKTG